MDDNEQDGMVALLPTSSDWCKLELPHMTVVYLGPIDGLSPGAFNELGKMAASIAMITNPIAVKVLDMEVLGAHHEEKVNTLRLEPTPQIKAVRHFFEMWDASEFDFHPHCTIGPADGLTPEFLPMHLVFDRIMVGWGDESLVFWLKHYN